MRKLIPIAAAAAAIALVAVAPSCKKSMHKNPFLEAYDTPYEIPPFDQITYDDYLPALREGIKQQKENVQAIIDNPETPTFKNTVTAYEDAGETLEKVVLVFSALEESNSSPEMQEIAETFYPELTAAQDELSMNAKLFERFKYLHDNADSLGLAADERRAVEKYYKNFVRNGALLSDADKEQLKALNAELATLYQAFNKNLLAATNATEIVVTDASRLAGIPKNVQQIAEDEGRRRNKPAGTYLFTVQAPSRLPLLQFADDRELRREMYEAYTTLASEGEHNNLPVIEKILRARSKKAQLLGFKDFGSYMTDNVMAGTVENAENLLMQIWEPAKKKVAAEVAEMQDYANRHGHNITIEPYDYYYYAEKLRTEKYNLNDEEVRGYFSVDSVRKGIFEMASRLYGVEFNPMPQAPKYFDEVKVYDVLDSSTGEHLAVFMTDYFSRPSKRQGAWMSEFKGTWLNEDSTWSRPVVFNVANFAPPVGHTPSLLSIDDVQTMFHEFGHGLHGMLTRARLKSQAGTSVDRDFVELPSQMHEHWALQPELLRHYARHYQTGEVIPDSLVEALNAAAKHNQGFMTAELVGAALLDLQFGKINPDSAAFDVAAFEKQVAEQLGMPAQLTYRYRPTYFKHIFGSDGYASGYYTYLWAEVLDTDAFELFEQNGVFDKATADSYRHNVLEAGDSEDPMVLFERFRGHKPTPAALLRFRGLTE